MEITRNNIQEAVAALLKCAEEHRNNVTYTGCISISDICSRVANYLKEQEKRVIQVEVKNLSNAQGTYLNVDEEKLDVIDGSKLDILIPDDKNESNNVEINRMIAALEQCAVEHKDDLISFGNIRVSDLCSDVANYLEKQKKSHLLLVSGRVTSQKGPNGIISTEVLELPDGLMVGDKVKIVLLSNVWRTKQ